MENQELTVICPALGLNQAAVMNCYRYGSRVYSTFTEHSDWDYIIVSNEVTNKIEGLASEDGSIHATVYSPAAFQEEIHQHEISVLECLFLPIEHVLKEQIKFPFQVDVIRLRHSVSAKASNSWVKAKKKLEVDKDYNPLIARKSLFHVFRILCFGLQIAKEGRILNYSEANFYWVEILTLPLEWEVWKERYQKKRNELETQFRLLASKA